MSRVRPDLDSRKPAKAVFICLDTAGSVDWRGAVFLMKGTEINLGGTERVVGLAMVSKGL